MDTAANVDKTESILVFILKYKTVESPVLMVSSSCSFAYFRSSDSGLWKG